MVYIKPFPPNVHLSEPVNPQNPSNLNQINADFNTGTE
jgi:hypothetical protein